MGAAARLLLVSLCAHAAAAFYLPGVAPQDFARDDLVYFKARTGRARRLTRRCT
jgi:hypothetical protein